MACLLVQTEQVDGGQSWVEVSLSGDREVCFLASNPAHPVVVSSGQQPRDTVGYIFRHGDGNGGSSWRLFAVDARIHLNGRLLPLGLEVLSDGDEIRIGACRMIFSASRAAHVQTQVSRRRPA